MGYHVAARSVLHVPRGLKRSMIVLGAPFSMRIYVVCVTREQARRRNLRSQEVTSPLFMWVKRAGAFKKGEQSTGRDGEERMRRTTSTNIKF